MHRVKYKTEVKGDFTCKLCNKKLANSCSLKSHINRHTQQKQFKCNLCEKAFVSKSELQFHLGSHERNGKKDVECPVCHKMLATTASLKAHEKVYHKMGISFSCTFCDKSFRWKGSLFGHILNHIQEKSHFCGYCGKECANKTNLEGHVRINTDERPFKCKLCEKTCTTAAGLRVHVLTHNVMKKLYECVFCEQRFITRITLMDHLRTEIGERPFECKTCDVNFSKSRNLSSHKKGRIHNLLRLAEEEAKRISYEKLYL